MTNQSAPATETPRPVATSRTGSWRPRRCSPRWRSTCSPTSPTGRSRPAELSADRSGREPAADPAARPGRARPGRRPTGDAYAQRARLPALPGARRARRLRRVLPAAGRRARSTRRCCTWTPASPAPARRSTPSASCWPGPDEARTFTAAQHAGSLAAARVLADRMPLGRGRDGCSTSAAAAARSRSRSASGTPALRATVLDFPAVVDVARDYRDEAGLDGRIDLVAGDAVRTAVAGRTGRRADVLPAQRAGRRRTRQRDRRRAGEGPRLPAARAAC